MQERVNLSPKQIIYMTAVYLVGSSFLIMPAQDLGPHSWLALVLSYLGFLVLFGLYKALLSLAPDKSLFGILELAFGRWLGLLFSLTYLFYFFLLLTLVVANFTDFITSVILVQTPELIITLFLVLTAAYAVRKGIEPIARISELILFMALFIAVIVLLLLYDKINFDIFLPIWPTNWSEIFKTSFATMTFPFGELIVFLAIGNQLGKTEKTTNGLFWGSLIALSSLLLIVVRNVAVLGEFAKYSTYPSYDVARLVDIANVITRAEVLISVNFLGIGYIKANTLYYSLCSGMAEVFRLRSYKQLVLPFAVLITLTAMMTFKTIIQNNFFAAEIYPFYAFYPQAILIAITLIALLIRRKKVS